LEKKWLFLTEIAAISAENMIKTLVFKKTTLFVAEKCRKSPKIAENRRKLPKIAENRRKSPKIAENCRKSPKIAENRYHNIDPRSQSFTHG
jgi:hypothetical protein